MAILKSTGTKRGIVIWRGDVWRGDSSLHKFYITAEEYDALALPGAQAPPMDPNFTGDKELWQKLWELKLVYAISRDVFNTPSGDPEPGDIILNASRVIADVDLSPGYITPITIDAAIMAAKTAI